MQPEFIHELDTVMIIKDGKELATTTGKEMRKNQKGWDGHLGLGDHFYLEDLKVRIVEMEVSYSDNPERGNNYKIVINDFDSKIEYKRP